MHVFFSAGEPSGDLHGANLIRKLQLLCPQLLAVGFGGERMLAAGQQQHFPLVDLAVMWFGRVVAHLPTFFKLARQTEVYFRTQKPDAVVLIDYPGFNFALAKRAHRAGIPVYYFVPPQVWAWNTKRVNKMRRWVTAILSALPFEDVWYRERGCRSEYIGHPYFDELAEQKLDSAWIHNVKQQGQPIIALLPGSRTQEVTSNGPVILGAAAEIQARYPEARFFVAAFKEKHAKLMQEMSLRHSLRIKICIGRTADIIAAADAAIAVSGSVGLELLYRLLPSVVVYKVSPAFEWIARRVASARYMSLVNLLVDRELFPEVGGRACEPTRVATPILAWLANPDLRESLVSELRALRERVAVPGACDRAAEYLLKEISKPLAGN